MRATLGFGMAGESSNPISLKEYLRKYGIDGDKEKKMKKKRESAKPDFAGVIVVDEDPVCHVPMKLEEEEDDDDSTDERKLRVDEGIVVKHMRTGRIFVSNNIKAENRNSDIRRRRNDTPLPEYRRKSCFKADSDSSPPRRPPKRHHQLITSIINSGDRDAATHSESDLSSPRKKVSELPISSRPKSGLISHEDFKAEIDQKRKEDWLRFNEMDLSISGRDAEPIYRNKLTGQRISKEEFLEFQKEKVKKKDQKPKGKKLEWSKGLAQKRIAKARMQEMEAEKDEPFSRSRDDPDLNAMLKERVRWGDPMAHSIKKKHSDPILENLGDTKEMKESGFIIPQDIPSQSWMRRGLDAAPNRYGINPGIQVMDTRSCLVE